MTLNGQSVKLSKSLTILQTNQNYSILYYTEMCKIDQSIRSGQTSYNENIKKVDSLNQIKLKLIVRLLS